MSQTQTQQICREETKRKAIRFLKREILRDHLQEYTDPFEANDIDGLKFLLNYDTIKDVMKRKECGLHSIGRYCNIIIHYIKSIESNEQEEDERKRILLVKKKYLDLAALAKREYRATNGRKDSNGNIVPSRKRETVVFDKMDDFQIQVNRQYQEYMDFHWNKYSLEKFNDQFQNIHRKLRSINVLDKTLKGASDDPNKNIEKDIPIRIIQQVEEIMEYKKKPRSKCAKLKKGVEPDDKITVPQYKQLFYLFIRKHREANNSIFGIEEILNDPDNNIFAFFESQLEADKKKKKKGRRNQGMSWSYIDNMTNALKFFIGCAFSIKELSAKGVNYPFCHYTLTLIEAWAGPHRITDRREKELKRKSRNPYEYLIQRYGEFYTWGLLRAETNRIKEYEDEPCLKLLLSLYGDFIPRRSSDYANMLIITDPNLVMDENVTNLDNSFNYLIWIPFNNTNGYIHRFVFNYWKCSGQKGVQAFDIINKTITEAITERISNKEFEQPELYPTFAVRNNNNNVTTQCQFLLYTFQKHRPIVNSKQLTNQLVEIRKRWDIPFSIRDVRHSYATWFQIFHQGRRDELYLLAENMGNSEKMLRTVYFDVQIVRKLTMDDAFEKGNVEIDTQLIEIFNNTVYDPNGSPNERRKDFENAVLNTDYVDENIINKFKKQQRKRKNRDEDGGHSETKGGEDFEVPERPKLSLMPKPTRYFGGLFEPCIGEARKLKYAALVDDFPDDNEDEEDEDAMIEEKDLLQCDEECKNNECA